MSSVHSFCVDASLSRWIAAAGLSLQAEQYARSLSAAGLDPRRAPSSMRELKLAGIDNVVHRRRLVLASHSASIESCSMTRLTRIVRLSRSPSLPRLLPLAHARAHPPLETVSAWTCERASVRLEDVVELPGFHPFALPIFANALRVEGRPPRSTPALLRRSDTLAFPTGFSPPHLPVAEGDTDHWFVLRGEQYLPRVSRLRAKHRSPDCVRLPQDVDCCTVRENVTLTPGSHAFVAVPGESRLRVFSRTAPFGSAGGHPQLAKEAPVLFAGEVLVGEHGRVLAWSNMSGTYKPPRELAAQVALPLELLWSVITPADLAAEPTAWQSALHGEEDSQQAVLSTKRMDARFGAGNHVQLPSGAVLVRDVNRCLSTDRLPLQRSALWTPAPAAPVVREAICTQPPIPLSQTTAAVNVPPRTVGTRRRSYSTRRGSSEDLARSFEDLPALVATTPALNLACAGSDDSDAAEDADGTSWGGSSEDGLDTVLADDMDASPVLLPRCWPPQAASVSVVVAAPAADDDSPSFVCDGMAGTDV